MARKAERLNFEPATSNNFTTARNAPAQGKRSGLAGNGTGAIDYEDRGLLHLGELVPVLRNRLDIGDELTDRAIFDSLKTIAARTEPRARWLSAFNSPLGHWLVVCGRDLNTALNMTLSMLPRPRN